MDKSALFKMLRGLYTQQLASVEALKPNLPDELKPLLEPVSENLNAVLAQIPQDQADDKNNKGDDVITPVLSKVGEIGTTLTKVIGEVTGKLTAQYASFDQKVADAITAKLSSGEYVTKADAEKAANDKAASVESRFKLIQDRRAQLQTASIPLPDMDAGLDATDEDFKKAIDTAKARLEDIKTKGISLNSAAHLARLAWATEQEYNVSMALLTEAVAEARKSVKVEPLANPGASSNSGDKKDKAPYII